MICNKASLYNNSKHVGVQVLSLSFIHGFLYKIFFADRFSIFFSIRPGQSSFKKSNSCTSVAMHGGTVPRYQERNRNSRIVSLYLVSFSRPRAGKTSMVMALIALDQAYSWTTPSLNQSGVHSSFQSTRLRSRFPQFNVWSFLHRFGDATDLIWWSWTCPLFNLAFVLHSTRPGARTMLHSDDASHSKEFFCIPFSPTAAQFLQELLR